MYIDLSVIPKDRPAAVIIPDKECGKAFLNEMRARYPKKVSNWYYATYIRDICYIPHFENGWGMTVWNVHAARNAGYAIIQWEEISATEVLETGVSEYSLSMLLE